MSKMFESEMFSVGYKDYTKGVAIKAEESYNCEYLNGWLFAEKITRCRFTMKSWHRPAGYRTSSKPETLFV